MEINQLFAPSSSFFLFLAPPAWGKTSLLSDLYCEGNKRKMVFVSPLRALANEFFGRVRGFHNAWMPESGSDLKNNLRSWLLKKRFILVVTPEQLTQEVIDELSVANPLFVLDEFHLFYRWGQSFRERMWECLMGISNSGNNILALSATMEPSLINLWERDFKLGMSQGYLLDCGNLVFKHRPGKIHYLGMLGKGALLRCFFRLAKRKTKGSETWLLFCPYRGQVESVVRILNRKGFLTLGCVGGETLNFVENLKKYPEPDFIVSTVALSHGVNLPKITKVFNAVTDLKRDMWLQMAARGGRKGEHFELYSLQSFDLDRKKKFKDTLFYGVKDGLDRLQAKFRML